MKLLIISCLVAFVSADVSHILDNKLASAKIIRQELDVGVDGQYHSTFETENGISASEQGSLKSIPGSDVPAEVVQGEAKWTAPDGQVIEFQYTADENGYHVQGAHLPTPPPIPESIRASLEYIKSLPPQKANQQ